MIPGPQLPPLGPRTDHPSPLRRLLLTSTFDSPDTARTKNEIRAALNGLVSLTVPQDPSDSSSAQFRGLRRWIDIAVINGVTMLWMSRHLEKQVRAAAEVGGARAQVDADVVMWERTFRSAEERRAGGGVSVSRRLGSWLSRLC